ncbi:MAG: hypothetical protein QXQ64_08335 [Candidatus Bathyarchaeia archaeon]
MTGMEDFFGDPAKPQVSSIKDFFGGYTSSDVVDRVLERFHIVTTDLGMYLYDESHGVYELSSKLFIESLVAKQARSMGVNTTIRSSNERFNIISRRTYNPDIKERPEIVNVKNGLLNVKTGELTEHTPAYFSTAQIPVTYDPNAKCPAVRKFLRETIFLEDIPMIQEFVGYTLYRGYPAAKALLLFGKSFTGKSTFMHLVSALLGKDNTIFSLPRMFAYNYSIGKLAAFFYTSTYEYKKTPKVLKQLIGGESVSGRVSKFSPKTTLTNTTKFIISMDKNTKKPRPLDFKEHFLIVPFPHEISGAEEDRRILEKLTTPEELSGFLNWSIEGLQRLMDNGFVFSSTAENYE